jgi:hypothetical protein
VNVRIVLHIVDKKLLLFAGLPAECPPIPRPGDEIVHENRRVRVEGVRHQYGADLLEILLLA